MSIICLPTKIYCPFSVCHLMYNEINNSINIDFGTSENVTMFSYRMYLYSYQIYISLYLRRRRRRCRYKGYTINTYVYFSRHIFNPRLFTQQVQEGKVSPFYYFGGYKCVYKHTFCVVPLWMFLNWKIIYYSKKKIVFFIGDFHSNTLQRFILSKNVSLFSSTNRLSYFIGVFESCNSRYFVTFCYFIQFS